MPPFTKQLITKGVLMSVVPDKIDRKPDGCGAFVLNIEGTKHEWPRGTITTEEIAQLGGWDPAIGVIEIDKHNNERTLQPDEVVELKPGHGFAKKVRWKRG
ncbi:MAG: multiubiquitin domain-containing protein [Planctomycetes bacterium]|nr:multiubiquitin domain-containing protein [Planctomycetota bacterium]